MLLSTEEIKKVREYKHKLASCCWEQHPRPGLELDSEPLVCCDLDDVQCVRGSQSSSSNAKVVRQIQRDVLCGESGA